MSQLREITSSQNETYKKIRKLLSQKSYRQECGLFVVEGKRLFEDAIKSGLFPEQILLGDKLPPHEREGYLSLGAPCCHIRQQLLDALSDTKTSQGVLAVFRLPQNTAQDRISGKSVLLSSLQDPGNIGTIIRTAEAFGLSRVLLTSDCPDLYSPKLLRATMGGVFRQRLETVPDSASAIRRMREEGVRVYAAALCEDAIPVAGADFSGDVCVVIGNEGNGLPQEVIALCDGAVLIPMRGKAQSLNAAMAAGILIYEMSR